MRRRVISLILGLLVAVPVLVSVAANQTNNDKSAKSSTSDSMSDTQKPIFVYVTTVSTKNIPNVVSGLGSLAAKQQVTISSEVDGRIDKIFFKSGQEVAEGMPIVQLDNAQAQADYQQAVTQLNLDQKNLQRMELVGDAVSQSDLDKQKATVKSDQANVQAKQAALNQKEIKAPFTGVLGKVEVNQGDFVSAGAAIVTLVNTKELHADYTLSEDLIPQLKLGQLVKLTVSAYPKQTFYGTVNFISPTVNQTTRAVAVQALVNNDKGLLSPGMFIHISQNISVQKNAVVIPEDAISANIKGHIVFVVQGGHAVQTQVTLGNHVNGLVQVISGLKVGDVVVTAGQQKLSDGMAVKILQSSGQPTVAPAVSTTPPSVTTVTTPATTTGATSSTPTAISAARSAAPNADSTTETTTTNPASLPAATAPAANTVNPQSGATSTANSGSNGSTISSAGSRGQAAG